MMMSVWVRAHISEDTILDKKKVSICQFHVANIRHYFTKPYNLFKSNFPLYLLLGYTDEDIFFRCSLSRNIYSQY